MDSKSKGSGGPPLTECPTCRGDGVVHKDESEPAPPSNDGPRTLSLDEVTAGADRAAKRVATWPQWKRELSEPSPPTDAQIYASEAWLRLEDAYTTKDAELASCEVALAESRAEAERLRAERDALSERLSKSEPAPPTGGPTDDNQEATRWHAMAYAQQEIREKAEAALAESRAEVERLRAGLDIWRENFNAADADHHDALDREAALRDRVRVLETRLSRLWTHYDRAIAYLNTSGRGDIVRGLREAALTIYDENARELEGNGGSPDPRKLLLELSGATEPPEGGET